jgi:hypothetical protein
MQPIAKLLYRSFELEDVAFSPLPMALLFTFIISFFLPKQDKYKLELIDVWVIEKPGGVSAFADLDGNGYSEHLISFENAIGNLALKLTRHDMRLIDQYNFTGSPLPYVHKEPLFTGDYNADGFQEIYALCWQNDSIFLDIISPLNPAGINRRGIFIDTIAPFHETRDVKVSVIDLFDFSGDGVKEVLIRSHAGFSLQPRRLYIYSIVHDSLYASPPAGVVPHYFHKYDITGDGYTELIGSTTGPGNIPPDAGIAYRDSSSWLMVFNHRLEFLFEPVEFPVYKSRLLAFPVFLEKDTLITAVFINEGAGSETNKAYLYNYKGQLVNQKTFPKEYAYTQFAFSFSNDPPFIYLAAAPNKVFMIDEALKLKPLGVGGITDRMFFLDIDHDGHDEILVFDKNTHALQISRNDFSHPASLQLPPGEARQFWYSLRFKGEQAPQLFMQKGEMCLLISYAPNPYYPYRFALYLLVLIPLWLLLLLLKKLFKYQLLRKQRLAAEIATLQYNSLNNQLDPHFILNAMNAISLSIKQDDPEKAYHYTARFSNLFRESLHQADKVSRSLEDELMFVEDYLQLEQLRHKNLFQYRIQVSDEVDRLMQIPKMGIQIFAENAVRHGLHPLGGGGQLHIGVEQIKSHTRISIQDNGIGREAAKTRGSMGSGKGLNIIHEIMLLYKKLSGITITYKIVDLKDQNGKSAGTRAELMLSKEKEREG